MLAAIVLLPLFGFLLNGLWYLLGQRGDRPKASAAITGAIASAAIAGSFACSVWGFVHLLRAPAGNKFLSATLFSWMEVGTLSLPFGLWLDPLSSVFCLVITGVGLLIHLYSIGYMAHDATPGKFFAYLNLFCAMMLVLVLGNSLPVTFLGWEGVGLCSYLLISYWFTDEAKASAGKKAFITNRIGDLGFLIGLFLTFHVFHVLDYASLQGAVPLGPEQFITGIALFFFLACTGKSAQVPLYLWLPDAMAGPTPVSALIHAATMVTSGIYLLARMSFLFARSPEALGVITLVGLLTAIVAGAAAVAQNDIKKVLAYSTVSQLGYMFVACGMGAFATGVFHVVTHAFFKALLFLGAGSVIHGMHEEQDIRRMGGLRTKLPYTFATFTVGWLAICGVPPLSGFFSKDEILWKSFSGIYGGPLVWSLGFLAAALTALYMTRLFALVFLGTPRSEAAHHAHESPLSMTLPLAVLALLAAVGGLLNLPHIAWLEHWLSPAVFNVTETNGVSPSFEWGLMGLSAVVAISMVVLGRQWYQGGDALRLGRPLGRFYPALENAWFVDDFVQAAVVRPLRSLSVVLWRGLDVGLLDRVLVGTGGLSVRVARAGRWLQTGSLQTYSLLLGLGLAVTVGYLIYGLVR